MQLEPAAGEGIDNFRSNNMKHKNDLEEDNYQTEVKYDLEKANYQTETENDPKEDNFQHEAINHKISDEYPDSAQIEKPEYNAKYLKETIDFENSPLKFVSSASGNVSQVSFLFLMLCTLVFFFNIQL